MVLSIRNNERGNESNLPPRNFVIKLRKIGETTLKNGSKFAFFREMQLYVRTLHCCVVKNSMHWNLELLKSNYSLFSRKFNAFHEKYLVEHSQKSQKCAVYY